MRGFKELLAGRVPAEVLAKGRFGFDIIGDVAIIEVARGQARHQAAVARALRELYPHLRAVAKKRGGHAGKYRIQELTVISGPRSLETEHRENGLRFRLDPRRTYFSPRLGEERLRTARLARKGERVLVMFSGIGAYPLVIARHAPVKEAAGVEWNPAAHAYALENIRLNRLEGRVRAYRGDVRRVVPGLGRFDRIIMPLPETGMGFLDVALKAARKGTIIHLYAFAPEDVFDVVGRQAVAACGDAGGKCRLLGVRKAGQHAPRIYRVRIDLSVARPR
jgi:tRNA (guanine37-N1)-methyltransferase